MQQIIINQRVWYLISYILNQWYTSSFIFLTTDILNRLYI